MLTACYACGEVHDKARRCRDKWGGPEAQQLTRAVIARDGGICHLCGEGGADSADHVISRAMGGPDTLDNLKAAHLLCNLRKGNA